MWVVLPTRCPLKCPSRRSALAMRWLVDSRKRGEKSMAQRLAGELLDAAEGRGAAVRKREDTHRMAEANRAFATTVSACPSRQVTVGWLAWRFPRLYASGS